MSLSTGDKWLLRSVAIAAFAFLGMGAYEEWSIGETAKKSVISLNASVIELDSTLEFINRPCASVDERGKLLQDGPICELDQAIRDLRKIATLSSNQVTQSGQLIQAATKTIGQVGTKVGEEIDALKGTTDAATGTAQELTKSLATLNDKDKGLPAFLAASTGLLANANGGVTDLRTFLKSNAVTEAAQNLSDMTFTGKDMLETADQVEQKATKHYLHPSKNPWVRTGDALEPYVPLVVKTASCWLVPGSCL